MAILFEVALVLASLEEIFARLTKCFPHHGCEPREVASATTTAIDHAANWMRRLSM
jgi:hypothetical protein